MNRRGDRKSRRATALLGLLAFTAGFTFVAATARGGGPPLEARVRAEEALSSQLAGEPAASLLGVSGERYALLEGVGTVSHAGQATRVRVASLGLDAEVRSVGLVFRQGRLQYDTPSVGAGHYAGTGEPGRGGNVVIGGHVALREGNGVFRSLPAIAIGETVEVFSGGRAYRYQVTEVRLVAPDATEVMEPTQDATLTLITCSNDDARSKRIVVVGKLV
jgi:LPXTG-site transpeptidase (sortase) family protein